MARRQVSAYINFQGRAREAMEFYREVLGGDLELETLGEDGRPRPAVPGDRITHARLEMGGGVITGSDGHPDYPAQPGDSMGLALGGDDEPGLAAAFQRLAEGGRVKMPLTPQPWGARAGWLTDRFGINWSVGIEKA